MADVLKLLAILKLSTVPALQIATVSQKTAPVARMLLAQCKTFSHAPVCPLNGRRTSVRHINVSTRGQSLGFHYRMNEIV